MKQVIQTPNAPAAIGTYSQAVKARTTVYLSGQIPLDPNTMELVGGAFDIQVQRAFANLAAVAEAAGGSLAHIVKLNIYLTDMQNFEAVNAVMTTLFEEPYPARAVVEVKGLPKNAAFEVDGVMELGE